MLDCLAIEICLIVLQLKYFTWRTVNPTVHCSSHDVWLSCDWYMFNRLAIEIFHLTDCESNCPLQLSWCLIVLRLICVSSSCNWNISLDGLWIKLSIASLMMFDRLAIEICLIVLQLKYFTWRTVNQTVHCSSHDAWLSCNWNMFNRLAIEIFHLTDCESNCPLQLPWCLIVLRLKYV